MPRPKLFVLSLDYRGWFEVLAGRSQATTYQLRSLGAQGMLVNHIIKFKELRDVPVKRKSL
jgi:hypothetical protein